MRHDSIKLHRIDTRSVVSEARRLISDGEALRFHDLVHYLKGCSLPGPRIEVDRHYADLMRLVERVATADVGYAHSYDGVSKLRRLTWRERLTGRVRP